MDYTEILHFTRGLLNIIQVLLIGTLTVVQIKILYHTYEFLFIPKDEWKSVKVTTYSTVVVAFELIFFALLISSQSNFFQHAN